MIEGFLIVLVSSLLFGGGFGFAIGLAHAAKQADDAAGLTAGCCEYPGCNRPWTAVVDLGPGRERWVCDPHVQPTVEAEIPAPFEALGVRERSRA